MLLSSKNVFLSFEVLFDVAFAYVYASSFDFLEQLLEEVTFEWLWLN